MREGGRTRLSPITHATLRSAAVHPFSLLELGCGVGNAFFPLVERLDCLSVMACDVSRRAVSLARAHPVYGASGRVCVFACDAVGPGLRAELEAAQAEWLREGAAAAAVAPVTSGGPCMTQATPTRQPLPTPPPQPQQQRVCTAWGDFDAVLALFVASALAPADHARLFAAAAAALRPGGRLLFRDYGVFDEAELRFRPGSRLGPHLFLRGDGTLAAFFSLPGLAALAAVAGLEVAEARYVLRRQRNRRLGTEMRRVYVQVRRNRGEDAQRVPGVARHCSAHPPVQAQFRRPDPLADAYTLAATTLRDRAVG